MGLYGNGALAQLGERQVRNLEVEGSIPLCSIRPETTGNSVFPAFVMPEY